MKNFICLNGKKIELTAEQVEEISKSLCNEEPMVLLDRIPDGDTFKIGEYEFIVLSSDEDWKAVILKDLFRDEEQFGENNNYESSNVDKICNEFAQEIAAVIGEEFIYEQMVDLTSDDGLKDYGTVKRKASLLTAELYRNYGGVRPFCILNSNIFVSR